MHFTDDSERSKRLEKEEGQNVHGHKGGGCQWEGPVPSLPFNCPDVAVLRESGAVTVLDSWVSELG